jgi:hypothetical protein
LAGSTTEMRKSSKELSMFKVIEIENFRGFQTAKLSGLSRINVITGLNGAGKTSLLEALFLICAGANASVSTSLSGFRGDHMISPETDGVFRSLFKDLNPLDVPKIVGSDSESLINNNKHRRTLLIKPTYSVGQGKTTTEQPIALTGVTFEFTGPSGKKISNCGWTKTAENQIFPQLGQGLQGMQFGGAPVDNPDGILAQFISPYVHEIGPQAQDHKALTTLTTERRINEVVEVLKIVQPALVTILPLMENNVPVILVDIGAKKLMPIRLLGSGLSNCMHIVIPLVANKDAVILIDEMEDGLHHSIFGPLLKIVFELARKNNNQIFISTHSNEFLSDLLTVAKETSSDDIAFYRLGRLGIRGSIPRYSVSEAHELLEAKVDLR